MGLFSGRMCIIDVFGRIAMKLWTDLQGADLVRGMHVRRFGRRKSILISGRVPLAVRMCVPMFK